MFSDVASVVVFLSRVPFSASYVVVVRRSKNRVAHGLAGNVGTNLWWGNVPEPEASIICIDFTSINE